MSDDVDRWNAALAGRYAIQRPIGAGGMATVYLARDVRHGRDVAIKVLRRDVAAAIGAARFLREIEVVARLNHPHILPLHDSGEADGALFYVMPYVDGGSLQNLLERERQLDIDDALRIAREVADALAYAHSRGVVHRDIKPANIMVGSHHARVADFGIALLASAVADERLTTSGLNPGTPVYMSPEQATGDAGVDGRSDIYSLGCVLYEMLAGDPPFLASNPRALLARKLAESPPSVRTVRETVPVSLERVVLKALARAPADRYRTAGEFAAAIEAVALARAVEGAAAPGARARAGGGVSLEGRSTGESAGDFADGSTGPLRAVARWTGIAAASLALLTAIGFSTTIAYDVALRVPPQYSPSRTDFPILGVRALIPFALYAFAVILAITALKWLLRPVIAGARRVDAVRTRLDPWHQRLTGGWQTAWRTANPAAVAELGFVSSIGVSILVLAGFFQRLPDPLGNLRALGPELLSCAARPVHRSYTLVFTLLILGLGSVWLVTSRFLRARRASGGRVAIARWAGLGWILVLVLLATAPWRLLWHNEAPRAMLGGERVYILLERGTELVLFNAQQRVTQPYRAGEMPELVRLHTVGYVFEDEMAFSRAGRGC